MYTPCGQVFTVRFTDTSTGVGTLVGGEFSQSLGSRLLVSVLRLWGLFAIQDTFVFFSWQSNERLNRHIGFNVIFAAVYYDVLLVFHDVNILLVYM